MELTITVTDSKSGKSTSWTSTNKDTLINQARLEVKAGASVEIKNALGRIIWSG